MSAPHEVRRSGNLIRVVLRGSTDPFEALEAALPALGRGERLEQTYAIDGHIFGYVARKR